MLLYLAVNTSNGMAYVGVTNNLPRRKNEHEKLARLGRGYALHRAIRKYGAGIFEWCILQENISIDDAYQLECEYIRDYKTLAPFGYNLTEGGDRPPSMKGVIPDRKVVVKRQQSRHGYKHSDATRIKQSIAARGRNFTPGAAQKSADMRRGRSSEEIFGIERAATIRTKRSAALRGRIVTEETKEKIRGAQAGRKVSEATRAKMSMAQIGKKRNITQEHRNKISLANKGRFFSPEAQKKATEAARIANTGKSRSEETIRKVSAANKGRKRSEEARAKMRAAHVRRKEVKFNDNQSI